MSKKHRMCGATQVLPAVLAIAVSGCSLMDQGSSSGRDWANLATASGRTHVFIFADADSIEARPMAGTSHRVDINSNYVGMFSNDEFVELELPAGQYAIEVYDYGWFGKLELHDTFNFSFSGSGQPSFLALTDHSDSLSLTPVSTELGRRSVDARSKAELAVNDATILAHPYHAPAGM